MLKKSTNSDMLDRQLLKNPNVLFAGYKCPHPLENHFLLRVQTVPSSSPIAAMKESIESLIIQVKDVHRKFEVNHLVDSSYIYLL